MEHLNVEELGEFTNKIKKSAQDFWSDNVQSRVDSVQEQLQTAHVTIRSIFLKKPKLGGSHLFVSDPILRKWGEQALPPKDLSLPSLYPRSSFRLQQTRGQPLSLSLKLSKDDLFKVQCPHLGCIKASVSPFKDNKSPLIKNMSVGVQLADDLDTPRFLMCKLQYKLDNYQILNFKTKLELNRANSICLTSSYVSDKSFVRYDGCLKSSTNVWQGGFHQPSLDSSHNLEALTIYSNSTIGFSTSIDVTNGQPCLSLNTVGMATHHQSNSYSLIAKDLLDPEKQRYEIHGAATIDDSLSVASRIEIANKFTMPLITAGACFSISSGAARIRVNSQSELGVGLTINRRPNCSIDLGMSTSLSELREGRAHLSVSINFS